jgi:hypothetical protein
MGHLIPRLPPHKLRCGPLSAVSYRIHFDIYYSVLIIIISGFLEWITCGEEDFID